MFQVDHLGGGRSPVLVQAGDRFFASGTPWAPRRRHVSAWLVWVAGVWGPTHQRGSERHGPQVDLDRQILGRWPNVICATTGDPQINGDGPSGRPRCGWARGWRPIPHDRPERFAAGCDAARCARWGVRRGTGRPGSKG